MKYLKFRKNKKTWSGKEAGQLFFMGLAEQAAYAKGLKPETEPPEITGELLGIAQEAIPNNQEEQFIYAIYRSLYYSISNYYNTVNKEKSTFYYASNILEHKLDAISIREDLQRELENVPLILTPAEYESKRQETLKNLRERKTSVYEAFFIVLASSLTGDKNTPQAIIDALEELRRTPATNSTLIAYYKGKNEMDRADTEVKATAAELLYKGNARDFVKTKTGQKLHGTDAEIETALKCIFDGTAARLKNPDIAILEEAITGKPQTPSSQAKTPDNLTLFDLLPQVIKISAKPAQVEGTALKREYLNEIKRELPKLYEAILDLIKQTPQAHGLKATQYYKDFATMGELEEAGLFGYDLEQTAATAELGQFYEMGLVKASYSDAMRAARSGVAIAERADYSEQEPLQTYHDILANVAFEKDRVKPSYEMLHDTMTLINAYNTALEIIARQFEVPQATAAEIDYSDITEWADDFNKRIFRVNASLYGDNEETKEKSRHLREILPLVDLSDTEPTDEQVARGAYVLHEMAETFETGYQLINLKQLVSILQE
jgi:hypothetical protein